MLSSAPQSIRVIMLWGKKSINNTIKLSLLSHELKIIPEGKTDEHVCGCKRVSYGCEQLQLWACAIIWASTYLPEPLYQSAACNIRWWSPHYRSLQQPSSDLQLLELTRNQVMFSQVMHYLSNLHCNASKGLSEIQLLWLFVAAKITGYVLQWKIFSVLEITAAATINFTESLVFFFGWAWEKKKKRISSCFCQNINSFINIIHSGSGWDSSKF